MKAHFSPRHPQMLWFLTWLGILFLVPRSYGAPTPLALAAAIDCTYTIPNGVGIVDGTGNYAQVKPGDTLCLPAGTRDNIKFVNLNGMAGSPITVRNSGGQVKITGMKFLTGGISILNSSYLRITGTGVVSKCGAAYSPLEQECGIELDHTNKGVRADTANGTVHDLEIDHVYVHDATTDTNSRGILIHPIEGQTISGFYAHHNYIFNTKGEALYVGAEPFDRPLEVLGKMENVEVSYNLVEQIGYDGIKIKVAVKNVKAHHNVVRNTGLSHTPHHDAGIQTALSVGDYYNNFVETELEGISSGRDLSDPGTRYFNNIVVGAQVGITTDESDAQVYNNTVIKSGTVGISATGATAQVFDNIVVDSAGTPIAGQASNIFNNLIGSASSVGFVNPAVSDYHLLPNSPAVDSGRNTGTFPSFDYDGTSRPQGSKIDLGAYELRQPIDPLVPSLSSLSPRAILEAEPSFTLTVSGAGFQNGAVVQWNGLAQRTIFVSSNELKASVSTSDLLTPGTFPVTVLQGSTASNAMNFTIVADNAPPFITRILPPSGSTLGNTRVTILGDHFKPELATAPGLGPISQAVSPTVAEQTSGVGVLIGGIQVNEVVFVSRTRLEVTTPAGPGGSADVTVMQSTGTAVLPDAYTYMTLQPVETTTKKRLVIPFAVDSPDFRTNLGINNLGEIQAAVDMLLVDNNGLLVARNSASVPAHGMKQINQVVRDLEGAPGPTGREGYLMLETMEDIGAWASQVDNVSLDPSMELGRAEAVGASQVLLPSSVSSSKFLTSLIVINISNVAGAVTIRGRDVQGNPQVTLSNLAIPARGYLFFKDFYRSVGLSNVFGPIEVEGAGGIKILATERIYTQENTSAYFEGVDIGTAARTVTLPYSVDTAEFRTNLGVNNVGSTVANVKVSLRGKDGLVLGSLNVTVPPQGMTQINDINRRLLNSQTVSNGEGTLWLEADQPLIAWSSQIDNVTQDPSLVVAKTSTATSLLIPSTTSVGDFKSTLAVVNLAATPSSVEVMARDNEGNTRKTSMVTIPGQGLITYTDILASLGLAGTFGPLTVTSLDSKPLLAVSRVYSTQRTGGYFEGLTMGAIP